MNAFLKLFLLLTFLSVSIYAQAQDRLQGNPGKTQTQQTDNAPATLVNQLTLPTAQSIVSSELRGRNPDSNLVQCADNFTVPVTLQWTIDSLVFTGNYSAGTPNMDSLVIAIHSDSAGKPTTYTTVAKRTVRPVGISPGTTLTVKLTSPIVLPAGNYWISVYAVYNTASTLAQGRWNWSCSTTPTGPNMHIRDETGLFGIPPFNWTPTSSLVPGELSHLFGLFGTSGPASSGGSITICRDGLNKAIPDNQPNNPVLDTITISGIPAGMEIKRITVTLDSVMHTWVGDLRAWLTKGSVVDTVVGRIGLGTGAFPGAGNSCDNIIGAKLVDTAVALIQNLPDPAPGCGNNNAQTQSNGYFKPKYPLTPFTADIDPNGVYILRITDHAAADVGSLRSWCVTVEYDVLTSNGNNTVMVDDYSLAQNYPNPFNPTTTIQYSIPKSGFVSLKVYDMVGKEVANLVSEEKQAGQHQVYFTAANLASGAYFYRIQVNDFIQVRRMVVVK